MLIIFVEDFSFFVEETPGCYFYIGCSEGFNVSPNHSATFVVDERCLAVGASIWVTLIRYCIGVALVFFFVKFTTRCVLKHAPKIIAIECP